MKNQLSDDEIRRLFAETPDDATEAEAQLVRTDPEQARRMVALMFAIAPTDTIYALVRNKFNRRTQLGERELATALEDDAEALRLGGLILDIMEEIKPGSFPNPPPAQAPAQVHTGGRGRKPKSG